MDWTLMIAGTTLALGVGGFLITIILSQHGDRMALIDRRVDEVSGRVETQRTEAREGLNRLHVRLDDINANVARIATGVHALHADIAENYVSEADCARCRETHKSVA